MTTRDHEAIAYIRGFVQRCGRFPSIREMCAGLALASTSSVGYRLSQLVRHGRLFHIGKDLGYGLVTQPGCCAACGQAIPEDVAATAAS